MSNPEKKYIFLREATKYCNYLADYLKLQTRQGKLKAVKISRSWLIIKEWLGKYLNKYSISNKLTQVRPVLIQPALIRTGILVALALVLLTAGIVFGKDSLKSVYQDLIDTQDRVLSRAVSGIENEEKEEVVKEEVPFEISEKEIEELRAEIKKLKEVGIQVKETIKEITKITQVEPVKEITKEVIKIDDKELAKIKAQLVQFAAWGADIENLRAITQKLQAHPAQTPVPTAPLYIGSQGIQVGGTGQFASLGVSGSAGIGSLGVGGSASIGSTASDKLTVAATSEFNAPVFAKAGLTVGTGTLNIDEKGNLITKGTVRMAGFQLGTTATAGHVLTTDASGVGTWQAAPAGVTWPLLSTIDGTVLAPAYSWGADTNMGIRRGGSGNLRFVTAGADRLTIDAVGNVGIGTDTPNNRLQVAGLINFNDLIRGTFLGFQAGNVNTGSNNSFIGHQAGFSNTTGFNNTFTGVQAGRYNTTGRSNTFIGWDAGFSNTTGNSNTFVGATAGHSNTTGFSNTFIGVETGFSNTTGHNNTFTGLVAGHSNTTGSFNTFTGMQAGLINTTGSNNTFTGTDSGFFNSTGNNNTFTGMSAGLVNSTGESNTFTGMSAGRANSIGFNNTFIGTNAGSNNTVGHNNTFTGVNAGRFLVDGMTRNEISNNSVFIGNETRASAAGNTNEIVIGANTIGNGSNTVTLGNTDIVRTILRHPHIAGTTRGLGGAQILALSIPDTPTVTVHGFVGGTTWGYRITARSSVGETLASIEGRTATGAPTLSIHNFNRITWSAVAGAVDYRIYRTTAMGTPSITGLIGTTTSTTFDDTGLAASGAVPTFDSSGNVGIGTISPVARLHAIGTDSLNTSFAGNIGGATGTGLIITNANNVGIGTTAPGTRRLAVVTTAAGAHPIASAWEVYSDIVRKENIRDIHYGLKEVLLLQPRSFNTKVGPSTSIGFIAQEIEKVIPEVVSGEAGQKGISYANLTALLTKAIQEQQKQIEELKIQLNQNGDLLQNGQEVNSQFVNSQSNNSLIETIKQVLASLGLVIENGITKVKELFAEKIFTKTARVEKLEMVDKATGEIFCTWIENGEWQKVKSSCDDLATIQSSTLNSGEPAPTGVSD